MSFGRRWGLLLGLCLVVMSGPGAAVAQEEELSVRGSVDGGLERGGRVRFVVTATHPDGWQALRTVSVILELHGAVLEEVAYDVDATSIEVGRSRAVAGTANVAEGRFFQVDAFGVEVGTGGDRLRLSFGARVAQTPPPEGRFRFVSEDDAGQAAETAIAAVVEEEDGGLSILAVVGAVVAALAAGGFIGSRLTAHRRSVPSVYATVARRLDESERPPPGRDGR